jgi:cytoskeletal protein CcmA (bactofilin family)
LPNCGLIEKEKTTMADPTTVIGDTITINGEFHSKEDVSIRGKVQGRIETTADLFVEEDGTVEAEVATRNIDVRGTVVGNVTASERFEIHPGGSVTGDVRAPRVVLADGGKYKGNIDMAVPSGRIGAETPAAAVSVPARARRGA